MDVLMVNSEVIPSEEEKRDTFPLCHPPSKSTEVFALKGERNSREQRTRWKKMEQIVTRKKTRRHKIR
jgi:hypothetical protein